MTRGKQSFLGGAALLTVTMLVTKAIGALYKIPLGNLLDEQGMNYFYAAYNIYNLLLMVSTAGLPLALSRLVSQAEALGWVNRRRRIVSVAFWLFLLLGLLSSGLMFFLAGDLAGWMHNTRAEDAIRVLSPAVLCVCLVSVIRGYTQGMGDMRPTAASEVIESASKLMVGLGLAWWLLRQGYPSHIAAAGAIAGVTAGVILSLLALTVWTATHLSRDKGRDDPGQSRDILRQLLAIGVPITVGSVSLSVINLLDQSITMGILQTSWGLTEAEAGSLYGVYSYAGNLFALPAAFIYPLTISLIPAIGAALARGDRASAGRHTAAAFRLTALLALPAGVGLSGLARPILELLYPAKGAATLEAAAYHLEILGVGSIFVCLMALSNGILQAYGREKVPLWTLLAGGGLKIALNYLMISNPDYGIRGLPVSTLCCYALITVLNLGAIARYVPERPDYFRVFSRPGLAALGMGAAAWWLHRLLADLLPGGLATLLAVALAAVIYAGAALLLGAVGREEAMALLEAKPDATIDTIPEEIRRQVQATRNEQKMNTTDNSMDILNKLPRFLSKAAIRFIRWLDRHGWCPDFLIGDDPNYSSVFLSNLGSIRLRSGYHHLTNWGTSSLFCIIGEKKWTPLYDQHGLVEMRETVDLGLTVDERIADGYYYAKSVRLFKYLLEHPALLERPMSEEVDYE